MDEWAEALSRCPAVGTVEEMQTVVQIQPILLEFLGYTTTQLQVALF